MPALRLPDGLVAPAAARDVANRLGLQTRPPSPDYDTIIGGGPAGLAAAVYGASEGLRTLVRRARGARRPGRDLSRIENYLGFPNGVSGDELAAARSHQARRLGAEILVTRRSSASTPRTPRGRSSTAARSMPARPSSSPPA